jgi:hypothetical protein
MKKSKFTEAQIVFAIKQSEQGIKVEEICRKMGISEATFYPANCGRRKNTGALEFLNFGNTRIIFFILQIILRFITNYHC